MFKKLAKTVVHYKDHMKQIITFFECTVELLNVKTDGYHSYRCSTKSYQEEGLLKGTLRA